MNNLPPSAQAIFNVTAESLAGHCGLLKDGQAELPDTVKMQKLKRQLGIFQTKPRSQQEIISSQMAATYLPVLVEAYRQNSGPLNSSMSMINVISHTPYFVRFLKTPAGQGIVGLQAKRTAAPFTGLPLNVDEIGEVCQFLSTLFVLQGTSEVDEEDKRLLLPKLAEWKRTYRGRLAAEASDRCYSTLTNNMTMRAMTQSIKKMLETPLEECGAPNCTLRLQSHSVEMMQCSRCKAAVYCGPDHQKQGWPSHKPTCFSSTF